MSVPEHALAVVLFACLPALPLLPSIVERGAVAPRPAALFFDFGFDIVDIVYRVAAVLVGQHIRSNQPVVAINV